MAFVSKCVHIRLISSTIQTFDRLAKVWRLILYLIILVTVVPISEENSTCTFNGIHYLCNNIATKRDFRLVLPTNVRKVTLMGTNELVQSFPSGRFTPQTWANVSELSILEFTNIEHIGKWFLNGLEELKFISISSCTHLRIIDSDTFYATPDIEELHLDGNKRLNLSIVEAALIDKLSNLRYLSLIGIQTSENHIVLGDNFLKALHGKNLSYLDISGVNIIIVEHAVAQDILANLKYLNLSYSKIVSLSGKNDISRSLIQSIGVLDLTGLQYIIRKYTMQGETVLNVAEFPKAMYLFLQGLVNPDTKVSLNIRVRFDNCDIKFPKMFDLSKNSFTHLNITFLGACRPPELETLNLEGNNMEYISPNFLNIFPSLKILDLSNNLLMKMQDMDEFSDMFSQNKDLEIVFLRNNHLTFVPSDLFLSNSMLRIIDLSENELEYFNINLRNAENIKLINLRRNRLKHVPASILEHFEPLFQKQNTESNKKAYVTNVLFKQFQDKSLVGKQYRYGYNASDEIEFEESHSVIPRYLSITGNILENQFVCDCDTHVFMETILFTNINIVNKTALSCKYGNNEKLLNNELFHMVQKNCRLATSIGIGVASSIAIILIIYTFVIRIHFRRKSARRNRDLENLKKELLQENENFKFLVFLSYCSQDAHIVDTNILPSLNRYLRDIFNTKRDLVCTGEDSFVPGMRIIEEIHRCINECLVVIPVITPAFLQSHWSQEECVAAVDRHRQVVILMKKHTDTSRAIVTIQNLIGQYTRGTWLDNEGQFFIQPAWNTICEGIIRAASESFRHRRQNCIVPAEELPLV